MQRERLHGLDSLRGMAAVSILLFHCIWLRSLIPHAETPSIIRMLYTGVPLFFGISAFSLCAGYSGRLGTVEQTVAFYKRRFLRIAPLFYVMAVVWVLVLSYLWQQWKVPAISDVMLNVTFLFNLFPGRTSLVPAGWSLSVEMIFYAAFPLLIFLVRGFWQALLALVVSVLAALVAGILLAPLGGNYSWFSVTTQLPFFVAGIFLFHAFQRLRDTHRRDQIAIALMLFTVIALFGLAAFGLVNSSVRGFSLGPHLIGLCLMPLVLAFALKPFSILVNPATLFVGKVSYGLYLIHPIIITTVAKPLQEAIQDTVPQWPLLVIIVGLTFVVSLILATFSYYCVERPMMNVKLKQLPNPALQLTIQT